MDVCISTAMIVTSYCATIYVTYQLKVFDVVKYLFISPSEEFVYLLFTFLSRLFSETIVKLSVI